MISETDMIHLRRCVELARTALETGDAPFGSILVAEDGRVLFEDHNHISGGDQTQHPEFAIARWAAENMTPEARRNATVYTSGEHCAMCAAAHGWVGLGRIVYAASTKQLMEWLAQIDAPGFPVRPLAISEVIPDALVDGPAPELAEEMRAIHHASYGR